MGHINLRTITNQKKRGRDFLCVSSLTLYFTMKSDKARGKRAPIKLHISRLVTFDIEAFSEEIKSDRESANV